MQRLQGKSEGMGVGATMAMACALVWMATPAPAEDKVVVIPMMEAPTAAPVPKTGQTTSYAIGDDGDLEKGVAGPTPRFTDNNNGTVTGRLTGLVWLKNGSCVKFFAGDAKVENPRTWSEAVDSANRLANGYCGLTDNSRAGDWRLPNRKELDSLIDLGRFEPALPPDCPLKISALADYYWSATSRALLSSYAWAVGFLYGYDDIYAKSGSFSVRAVRGGQ